MSHILLIEDDPAIAFMYETKLKAEGYDIIVKRDGVTGWQELTQGKKPDLLLLDIVLPKKDGFEILKDLRAHPQLHDLKVILLTNLGQKVDIEQGQKLGATDYVIKAHITPKELVEKIKQQLG
jgi:DNA-binding response OmpR family regulator